MPEEGHPTDEELARIREWPPFDWAGLLDFVKAVWWAPDWGWTEDADENGSRRYRVSTGGWSGNEDAVDALNQNLLFWAMCWVSSRRGGHYEFVLPQSLKTTPA